MKKGKRTKKINKIILVIEIILIIAFVSATAYLVYRYNDSKKNQELYEDLGLDIMEEITKVNSEFIEKVKELQQENSDVVGWIRIENTNINYPLLQGTDNDYYLTHNYKKEYSSYGSIYLKTQSDIKDVNSNVHIYGHSMKDKQMFGMLKEYKNKEFYEQHPIIYIATEEDEAEYQIIYVFKSRIFYKDETNVFRYYQCYNFNNEEEYNYYIENCKAIQLYDTGITAKYGEQLITLSTCDSSQDDTRIVVVAKKI